MKGIVGFIVIIFIIALTAGFIHIYNGGGMKKIHQNEISNISIQEPSDSLTIKGL